MAYSPENNPYIPGDPYSYDLKWIVKKIKEWKDPLDSAAEAKASEEAAAQSAAESAQSATKSANSATQSANSATQSANSAEEAREYAENIADPVSGIVTNWLNTNITQPSTPVVDTSLSVSGAAADAKVTGDYVHNIANVKKTLLSDSVQWVVGSISSTNGWEVASTTRIRSDYIDLQGYVPMFSATIQTGYKYIFNYFTATRGFIRSTSWATSNNEYVVPPANAAYVRITLATIADSTADVSFANYFELYGATKNYAALTELQRLTNEKVTPELTNGTIGNGANGTSVATLYILPIPKRYDYAQLEWTGYDITTGYSVGFGYCIYDGATDGMTNRTAFDNSSSGGEIIQHNYNAGLSELTDKPPILTLSLADMRTQGQHFAVAIFCKNNGTFVPLRITNNQYQLKITYGYYDQSESSNSIIELNKNIADDLKQANRPINLSLNDYLTETQPVTLLHISDIHASVGELGRIIELKNTYNANIDDIICTGDMVGSRYQDGMAWFTNVSGSENILLTIGNHDALNDPSGFDFTQLATQAQQYAQYFAPYITNWNCQYTNGKTYYYKDYAVKKVRLIVLNCMLSGTENTEQLTWFTSVLNSAAQAGLTVIVAAHYAPNNSVIVASNFTNLDAAPHTDFVPVEYQQAVANFKAGGGMFACYIAGHYHYDSIVTPLTYPDQYCICIDALNPTQSNAYSDIQRTNNTKSQDLANLITIDTSAKAIKITRVGADKDHYLRSRKHITIKYDTSRIISFD